MKRFLRLLIILSVVSGCQPAARMSMKEVSRTSPAASSFSPYPTLKSTIDALLPDSLFPPASVGMKIVSLSRNETLYELNPSMLFVPASNQKLLTSAAALSVLGGDFLIDTKLFLDSSGVTIYVKGFGDPVLSVKDADSIVSVLATRLPAAKSWTLIGDVSYFDDLYWGSGWMWDDEPDPTAPLIAPLCVNNNAITVRVRPGARTGDPVNVTTEPPTNFVSILNAATTVSDSVTEPIKISRNWRQRSNTLSVTGQIRLNDTATSRVISVWDPSRYLLALLSERLQARGFRIETGLLDTVPAGAQELLRYAHRLDSVVFIAMKESDNLAAENLLKIMGAEKRRKPGTGALGISVMKEFLSQKGIDTTKLVLADGSGVSRYNLLSAEMVVQLLEKMYTGKGVFETFVNALPIAGTDGSLSNRMKGTNAEGNLRAKTGTLSGVSSLSGYVRTVDGEVLAFSVMMQKFPGAVRVYRNVQDAVGILLSEMRRENL